MADEKAPVDDAPLTQEQAEEVRKRVLRRDQLQDEMDPGHFEQMVQVTEDLIDRRFRSMQEKIDFRSKDVNVNPFLMLAMAPAYNIYSPFEAAEYTQNAKLPHGDATAFGKFVEGSIFSIFGVTEPPEKKRNKDLYSPVDAEITVDGNRYFTTWKSGPWTMNQSHTNEMGSNFPQIHQETGHDIILGIFYGTVDRLNNKPALVTERTGDYFHVLVGKDLWEFVTGVKDAHLTVLKAIRVAQGRFAEKHGGKTFYEHLIEARLQLAESFREAFELKGAEDDMWEMMFRKAF